MERFLLAETCNQTVDLDLKCSKQGGVKTRVETYTERYMAKILECVLEFRLYPLAVRSHGGLGQNDVVRFVKHGLEQDWIPRQEEERHCWAEVGGGGRK
jgi:hypothetical protein